MHIDINTTLRDAQNEVVLSLLPRQHGVAIEGRCCSPAGHITPLVPACLKCGKSLASHAGWALRHLYVPSGSR